MGALLAGVCFAGGASGQTWTKFEDGYTQAVQSQHVSAISGDAFGDQTDWYTGSTSFLVTDVSLPGNDSLVVAFQRRMEAFDDGIGNWFEWSRYEVPYIHGLFKANSKWQDILKNYARCSIGMTPPEVTQSSGKAETFFANEYWHGNFLYVPGSGSQKIFGSRQLAPQDGRTYKGMTNTYWHIACLPTTANGEPGEGFFAVSPDGTKYYFDWLIQAGNAAAIKKEADLGGTTVLNRSEYRMLVTRVEDRFGNWVEYAYSGKDLASIKSSDGRSIAITYVTPGGAVSEVSVAGRKWLYDYSSGFRIVRPDGSVWSSSVLGTITRYSASGVSCVNNPSPMYSGSTTVKITLPSGALAEYVFSPVRRGISYVPFQCVYDALYEGGYPEFHRVSDNIGLARKTISGAGLPSQTWVVNYGASNECYIHATYSGRCVSTSPVSRQIEILGPANTYKRYTFGNKFRETDGMLQKLEIGNMGSGPLRTVNYAWDDLGPAGSSMSTAGHDWLASRRRLEESVITTQEGVSFSKSVIARDANFGFPTRVTRTRTTTAPQ